MFAGKRVHLMGIGGCGVSALVPLLRARGALVSGCDLAESERVARLRHCGVDVAIGHDARHVAGVDMVVHSGAVPQAHPELQQARAQGALVLSRAACLAELVRAHPTVAVAGSHGKTSTTWMIAHLLIRAGLDPVVMVGGAVPELDLAGGRAGGGQWLVTETDESDGGFAHTDPRIAVVVSLDDEHAAHYGSVAGLHAAFAAWLAKVPADGAIILGPQVPLGLVDNVRARVLRCASTQAEYQAREVMYAGEGSTARVFYGPEDLGLMAIPLPGAHQIGNALCALAAARAVTPSVRPTHLAGHVPVRRRFTVHGTVNGVRVVEDYGHHPAEIAATIAAAALAGGKVHMLFQPHRYSRTRDCFAAFTQCFDAVQSLAMLPIYPAGEEPLPGISALQVCTAIAARLDASVVQYCPSPEQGVAWLRTRVHAGDTVLVQGAGDVGRQATALLEALA